MRQTGPVTVAVDLLGGDDAPGSVVDGALVALDADPELSVVLVGPPSVAEAALAERGATGRCALVAASQVIGMTEDPARAVRIKRDATVRVAARLVRDGAADATVSIGSTGAAMAAGLFTLGRLPGMSRPALATVVPARRGPLVFLDAGANLSATPDLLAQFALAGTALAQVRLGIPVPRVGLLSVGEEVGKGDLLRRSAYDALAALPIDFIGNVEGGDVPHGGVADVVVTDGFTGNVLAKGLEGALTMLSQLLLETFTATGEGRSAASWLLPAMAEATGHMGPDQLGGGMLLGLSGVAVVGHGASSPAAVAANLGVAAHAVRAGLVDAVAAALADLLAHQAVAATPVAATPVAATPVAATPSAATPSAAAPSR